MALRLPEGWRTHLAQRNIELSWQRYGVDALNFMALGLFSSLVLGLILKNIGQHLALDWLVQIGTQAQQAMGAAIGVGVAYALKAPPLVLCASVITGTAGAVLGGPLGAFFAAAVGAETGKLVHKTTALDIVLTPAVAVCSGMVVSQIVGVPVAALMQASGSLIEMAVDWQPVLMSVVVAVVMGMILTLPISSAAIAISLSLSGDAAGAATIGCCAQMVGFAVMGFGENRWAGVFAQGLGTSMLQMPNIVRNPKIWLPPTLAGALTAALAAVFFPMQNIPIAAGMGSSGLVGQIGTFEAMGIDGRVGLAVLLFHFVLPAVFTLLLARWLRRLGWIKSGDLKLSL